MHLGNIISCSLAAYAFARLNFPGKRVLFALVLATLLLPYQVTIVPQYVLFNELAWINTILPLTVPKFLATDAFFVFLMVQFIRTLPRELDEAARLDGCGHIGIFLRVILPLSLPAIGTTAMFTFVRTWDDFLGPLLYLNNPDRWTVAAGAEWLPRRDRGVELWAVVRHGDTGHRPDRRLLPRFAAPADRGRRNERLEVDEDLGSPNDYCRQSPHRGARARHRPLSTRTQPDRRN